MYLRINVMNQKYINKSHGFAALTRIPSDFKHMLFTTHCDQRGMLRTSTAAAPFK